MSGEGVVEMADHWSRRGVRMLTAAQDVGLLRSATERAWEDLQILRRPELAASRSEGTVDE